MLFLEKNWTEDLLLGIWYFYLWRSRAGLGLLCDVLVVVVMLVEFFCYCQDNLQNFFIKIKLYILRRKDPVSNLSPLWLTVLPKIAKNNLSVFHNFTFCSFWPPKWPPNSDLTWSAQHNLEVPNLFNFMIFLSDLSLCLKIWIQIYSNLFSLLAPFCSIFHIFLFFSLSVFISLPQVFEQSLFLF